MQRSNTIPLLSRNAWIRIGRAASEGELARAVRDFPLPECREAHVLPGGSAELVLAFAEMLSRHPCGGPLVYREAMEKLPEWAPLAREVAAVKCSDAEEFEKSFRALAKFSPWAALSHLYYFPSPSPGLKELGKLLEADESGVRELAIRILPGILISAESSDALPILNGG